MPDISANRVDLIDIVSFLERPSSYSHRPDSVEIIQTHISYVAIAPPYVFKLKKPVDLGFLNFSSLDQRHHYCKEEVRLNRRLCSDTYICVEAISLSDEGLTFRKGLEVVDYMVKMKLLDRAAFLDHLAKKGLLTNRHIDRIVEVLIVFYRSQTPSKAIARWGDCEAIRINTDEKFRPDSTLQE